MSNLTERITSWTTRKRPPGPGALDLVRCIDDYRRNSLPAVERLAQRYGDIVCIDLPGTRAFLFSHPDLIQHVLIKNRDNYLKIPAGKSGQRFFGTAMQLNNGEYARSMRRLMAPIFQPDRLARTFTPVIAASTRAAIAAWKSGPQPGITQELLDLAMNIAMQVHFGSESGEDPKHMGRLFLAAMSSLSNFMLPDWIPTARNRRYHEAVAALDAEVMKRIRKRRDSSAESPDLLSGLVRLEDESGKRLSDQQVRDEIVSMTAAGYQSVGIALCQTLRLLAETPEVEARLAKELSEVLAGRMVTADELGQLTYSDKIIKESLRCCPPAGVISRQVVADDTVAGWSIPAGSRVFLSAWVLQRDHRLFANPMAFDPERWTPEFEQALPMCAYFPFGRGPRGCIAGALASLTVQIMVVTIAQQFQLQALQTTPPDQTAWPTILKNGGLKLSALARQPAGDGAPGAMRESW